MSDTELTNDQRPIMSVWWTSPENLAYQVGMNCDSIEAYEEHGHMSMVPWIRVIRHGEVIVRFAADHASIHYMP